MKNIFLSIKTLMSVIALSLAFNACVGDLDQLPKDPTVVTDNDVFAKPEVYKQYLAKLYQGLAISGPNGSGSSDIQGLDAGYGQYMRALWMMQVVPTDEAILHWGDAGVPDMSIGTWTSSNQFIRAMYLRIVYQTRVTSEYLMQTTDGKLNDRGHGDLIATIKPYRAEARFLRALSYVHAIDLFGKCGFIDESVPVGVLSVQKSRTELFDYAESELLAIIPDLAAPRTNEYGRVDKAAAWMLLAKMYLNAGVWTGTNRYADCITMCDNIINAGYTLAPDYSHLFMADNERNDGKNEYIFLIPQDGNHLQAYGCMTFIINSQALTWSGNTYPDIGVGGWNGLTTRREFVNLFNAYLSDKRRMLHEDKQSLDITVFSADTQYGYAVTKFKNLTSVGGQGAQTTFVDTDYPLFRLADVYLMYAEANLRGGGGDAAKALDYVNQIRGRAGIPGLGYLTLDAILDERGRELYWEGWRRQDLIRFGKFTGSSYLWQWKGNSHFGTQLADYRALYPIPSDQLGLNPNLTQNPGY